MNYLELLYSSNLNDDGYVKVGKNKIYGQKSFDALLATTIEQAISKLGIKDFNLELYSQAIINKDMDEMLETLDELDEYVELVSQSHTVLISFFKVIVNKYFRKIKRLIEEIKGE